MAIMISGYLKGTCPDLLQDIGLQADTDAAPKEQFAFFGIRKEKIAIGRDRGVGGGRGGWDSSQEDGRFLASRIENY